ncbi:MAG: DNA polymerase III subunit delta [Candidatus Dojkabacteria bacterium]
MYKLYIGNDTYISLTKAKSFVNQLKKENSLESITIDVEKINASDLIDNLSSNSLFSDSRIFFLKRVYRNKEKDIIIEFLLNYLQNENGNHIVIWEDQKVSSVTKYVKFFKTNNLLEENSKLNKRTFQSWGRKEAEELEINISNEAILLLSQYSNYDTERFINSLKKLKLLNKEKIEVEDIRDFSTNTLEDSIWEFLDEINNNGKPLTVLNRLLNQGVDPHFIISMISRNIRLIALTKHLIEKRTPYSQMASILKIPPFLLKSLIDSSNRYSIDRIKKIYEKLASLDYEIKSGKLEPNLGLTLLSTIL